MILLFHILILAPDLLLPTLPVKIEYEFLCIFYATDISRFYRSLFQW